MKMHLKKKTKNLIKNTAIVGAVMAVAPVTATAGSGGAEFQDVHTTFEGWVQGYAGMAISVAAIGLGGLASLARQSPFPILTGIGSAILLQYSPDVVSAIFSATI
jgi:conjugal transfer pilus assembly protein TraA